MLSIIVTLYGVLGASSSLLQVRRMQQTQSSRDISILFLSIYTGGYFIWLAYGIIETDWALIIVDIVGAIIASITFYVTLQLRVKEGQTVWEAIRNDTRTVDQLQWLRPSTRKRQQHAPKYPFVFNRLYPLKAALPASATVTPLPGPFASLSYYHLLNVSPTDACLNQWRQHLGEDIAVLPQDAPTLPQMRREVLRQGKPAQANLYACRKGSLLACCQHICAVTNNDRTRRVLEWCQRQIATHPSIELVDQIWIEQILMGIWLHEQQLLKPAEQQQQTVLEHLAFLDLPLPVGTVPAIYVPYLFPYGTNFGSGDPLIGCVLQHDPQQWTDDARMLLLAARPRAVSKLGRTRPLSRSLNQGWASLIIDSVQPCPDLYPLESALVALCFPPDTDGQTIYAALRDVDCSETDMFVAHQLGISLEFLRDMYEQKYRQVAKRAIVAGQTPALQTARLRAAWQEVLYPA